MKRRLAMILSLVCALSLVCTLSLSATADTAASKPTLKILYNYVTFDMNEDPVAQLVQDITGMDVEFYLLPQSDADQHLMMEIAGGADYDIVFHGSVSGWGQMKTQNAVLDITDLLAEKGGNITALDSEMVWSVVTDADGRIFGIPRSSSGPISHEDNAYGLLRSGIAFRSDALAAMNKEVPHTVEDLLDVWRTYKTQTGNIPFTANPSALLNDLMSAFNLSSSVTWYDTGDGYTPLIKMPALVEYITFVQDLYAEGLIDPDMPINTNNSRLEKFTNGTAMCTNLAYWDIPGVKTSLELSNPDAKVLISALYGNKDAESVPLYFSKGITYINWIPRTAANPDMAIEYLNTLADVETQKRVYIGEENVSYEETETGFYPIFPAFNDYMNSDKYLAILEPAQSNAWGQARARKTADMAEAYDFINSRIGEYTLVPDFSSFANTLPEMQEYNSALNTLVNDGLLKAVTTGEDAQTVIDGLIAEWENNGGLILQEAMNAFYKENSAKFVF